MNDFVKNIILWVVVAIVLMTAFEGFNSNFGNNANNSVAYSTFLNDIRTNTLKDVDMTSNSETINVTKKDGTKYQTVMPMYDRDLLADLSKTDATVTGQPEERRGLLTQILISWFPMLLLIGFYAFYMRQMQGGGGKGAFSFGKSKAKMLTADQVKTTFADVAGCDEAKEEVGEVVDFLRDPSKFQKLGGRIPKGILMVGPPGTGKTLLAKAIAGEAKVPFFTMAGSDFVEMFVGVGASRVRDLFEQAKKNAPCIIFIDEIDAVGRKRGGAGFSGGHDEREQTLNQMLVEMDGFEGSEGVIIIAATNRADVLDDALTRPGRFDRQVTVDLPNVKGREQILQVHLKKVPLAEGVDAMQIARGTPGYSGAQLANLVNEAALFAARKNRRVVTMEDFEQARDKINMGPERRSNTMTEKEIINTAYHEAGHVIVGYLMPEHDPLNKVTIVPRGQALGFAQFLPEGDRVSETFTKLESQLSTLFAGRIAEGLIFGEDKITTGASSDIHRATQIARAMVTQWGFSKELGPIFYQNEDGMGAIKGVSEESQKLIDTEMRKIIDRNYNRAKQTLEDNIDILHAMKDALLKYETLDRKQIDDLMARRPVGEPSGWNDKPTQGPSHNNKETTEKPVRTDLEIDPKEGDMADNS
ncbi:ATP-dependent zinc metalloprotease FtsH [Haemophilus parahaemolyticus]|uniref:ATP-dependent zinc metalloprotease FtsH n=2 Tax=Haemophilus parahaemolyticus TaxID=735 RepID=A0AAE6JPJ4_HAEPH|nr:ATP-dependent zinc metalloprotease FtsH [Haemophilus parahaemolyticus]EIJ71014.1 ATP-dependent metallopeptidase HflB [Haemophilus parahaemolyticus HK385]OOR97755.1 ATP-dependent metalloprotease [Haemophilus parahaemolyticus]QEN10135.1 ATP-dependent zinc metalloprotease FtsH [Haemophilus parahaemolyticus]QRP13122.1 ATP-dependent zinc metalloprotease FtsH [Haemophilus parahaemolyticus]STO66017.1 cell division protein, FtsH [Haemophilus parahaemolyticus HK385]